MRSLRSIAQFILTVGIVSTTVVGCKETFISYAPTGTMHGVEFAIDSLGHPVVDSEGVLVEIEGLSRMTHTDSSGVFEFHEVPTATYSMLFSKKGYMTQRVPSVSFVGGGVQRVYSSSLLELVRYSVTIDSLTVRYPPILGSDTISWLTVAVHLPYSMLGMQYRTLRCIVSTVPNPDFNDVSSFVVHTDFDIGNTDSSLTVSCYVPGGPLNHRPHSTLYVEVVPFNSGGADYDEGKRETIYHNLGPPSNTLILKLP